MEFYDLVLKTIYMEHKLYSDSNRIRFYLTLQDAKSFLPTDPINCNISPERKKIKCRHSYYFHAINANIPPVQHGMFIQIYICLFQRNYTVCLLYIYSYRDERTELLLPNGWHRLRQIDFPKVTHR